MRIFRKNNVILRTETEQKAKELIERGFKEIKEENKAARGDHKHVNELRKAMQDMEVLYKEIKMLNKNQCEVLEMKNSELKNSIFGKSHQ